MGLRVTVATFGLFAFAWVTGAVRAENLVMPQELVEHVQAHGCRPVADFYTRPGVVGQPFVYGYVPGPQEESAAYWCERGSREHPAFRLMLMFKDDRHELARCPRHIEWGDRIGGLSIQDDDTITLDGFVPLDHRASRPPTGTHLRHSAIRSEYEGAGVVFYCHEGWWFVRMSRP